MQRKCIICEHDFEVYDKPKISRRHTIGSKGSPVKYRRPHRCVTCSPECSKVYCRVVMKIAQRKIQERKNGNKSRTISNL